MITSLRMCCILRSGRYAEGQVSQQADKFGHKIIIDDCVWFISYFVDLTDQAVMCILHISILIFRFAFTGIYNNIYDIRPVTFLPSEAFSVNLVMCSVQKLIGIQGGIPF